MQKLERRLMYKEGKGVKNKARNCGSKGRSVGNSDISEALTWLDIASAKGHNDAVIWGIMLRNEFDDADFRFLPEKIN
jgi:TPR repeat protein